MTDCDQETSTNILITQRFPNGMTFIW